MISIFDFDDYRAFLKAKIAEAPKAGYGQAKRLAEHLGVHTTLVSQALKGLKTFTMEQAALTTDFLGCTELESEYFLLLVQLDRAGNEQLRRMIRRQIQAARAKSKDLVNRLQAKRRLTEPERALFYSDWSYSAIRQMTAIKGFQRPETIAESLDLPLRQINDAIEFLVNVGLCKKEKGLLGVGPSSTHIENSSPWVKNHHTNWRLRSMELMRRKQDESLRYTAPMTLSARDAERIRELISQLLERIDHVVDPSPSEELHCLTIDWFRVDQS